MKELLRISSKSEWQATVGCLPQPVSVACTMTTQFTGEYRPKNSAKAQQQELDRSAGPSNADGTPKDYRSMFDSRSATSKCERDSALLSLRLLDEAMLNVVCFLSSI